MGIVIDLRIIPSRIHPDRWKSVYMETLQLVEAYEFMDRVVGERNGLQYDYAERTKNRKNLFGTGAEGWHSVGDMQTGCNTDDFALLGNIQAYQPKEAQTDKGEDILLDEFYGLEMSGGPAGSINIWGGSTNGQDSHIYLLAVACLIVDRLPEAAMVSGSISAGQCQRAVRWANRHLSTPVHLPDTGCREKLLRRLRKSSLSAEQVLEAFYGLTIEAKDKGMGDFLRKELKEEEYRDYYQKRLGMYHIGQRGFVTTMKEYLEMGFAFRGLCEMAVNAPEGSGVYPEEFLRRVMESKLHIKDKVTGDFTRFAASVPESEEVEDIGGIIEKTLGLLCGAENRNVNAYYPLEKIRADCQEVFGDRCNVDETIDRLLAADGEDSDRKMLQRLFYDNVDSFFRQDMLSQKKKAIPGNLPEGSGCDNADKCAHIHKEKYHMNAYRDLKNFFVGCTIRPELDKDLTKNFQMIRYFAEAEFEEFRAWDRTKRENFFINNNKFLLLSKEVWDRIFDRVMDDAYIIRFYGIFNVNCYQSGGYNFCKNILTNLQALDYYWDKAAGKNKPAE